MCVLWRKAGYTVNYSLNPGKSIRLRPWDFPQVQAIFHSIPSWKKEYWELTLAILLQSEGYITQYTPQGVYWLIVNEINEGIMSLMIVKMVYCPYYDLTRYIRSNIPLCLQEFPWASPSAKGYTWPYIPPLVLIRIQYIPPFVIIQIQYIIKKGLTSAPFISLPFTLMHLTSSFLHWKPQMNLKSS